MKVLNTLCVLLIFDFGITVQQIDPFNPLPDLVDHGSNVKDDKNEELNKVNVEPTTDNTEGVLPLPETVKKEYCQDKKADTPKELASCSSLTTLFKQYLLQLVNLLEPHVDPFITTDNLCLRVSISDHDLQKFRQYTSDKPVHDVHEVLSNMLQDTHKLRSEFESRIYWLEEKLGLSSASLMQIALIFLGFALVLHALPKLGRKQLLPLLFTVSVIFTWFEMLQNEQANQEKILSEEMSKRCPNLEKMTWFERMGTYLSSSFTFQDEYCREFYQAMIVNPLFKVNPLQACANAIMKTVMTPLETLAVGLKKCLTGLLFDLPYIYQVFMLVFLVVFLLFTMLCISGYRIRVPFLLSIEPAQRVVQRVPIDQLDSRSSSLNKAAVQGGNDGLADLNAQMAALCLVNDDTDKIAEPAIDTYKPVPDAKNQMVSKVSHIFKDSEDGICIASNHDLANSVPDKEHPVQEETLHIPNQLENDTTVVSNQDIAESVSDIKNPVVSELLNIPEESQTKTPISTSDESKSVCITHREVPDISIPKVLEVDTPINTDHEMQSHGNNDNEALSNKEDYDIQSSTVESSDPCSLQQILPEDIDTDCSVVQNKEVHINSNDYVNSKSQDSCSQEAEISSSTHLASTAKNCSEIETFTKKTYKSIVSDSNESQGSGDYISKEEDA